MADVIGEENIDRLVSHAKKLFEENCYSPLEIIKSVRLEKNCSIAEAKEAYLLASNNESLGSYQEKVIVPLLNELEKYEARNEE